MNAPLQTSHRESHVAYDRVVVMLNDNWRLIVCKDGIQWILQRRVGERAGGARFDSRQYLTTKEGVMRACRTFAGAMTPQAAVALNFLPKHIGGA